MSLNNCSFSGNIGGEVKVNTVKGKKGDNTVANFSVAVNGYDKNADPMWVNCSLWGKRAESGLTQYLTKGQTVIVTGELSVRQYESSKGAGVSVDLNVSNIELVGGQSKDADEPRDEVDPGEGL